MIDLNLTEWMFIVDHLEDSRNRIMSEFSELDLVVLTSTAEKALNYLALDGFDEASDNDKNILLNWFVDKSLLSEFVEVRSESGYSAFITKELYTKFVKAVIVDTRVDVETFLKNFTCDDIFSEIKAWNVQISYIMSDGEIDDGAAFDLIGRANSAITFLTKED